MGGDDVNELSQERADAIAAKLQDKHPHFNIFTEIVNIFLKTQKAAKMFFMEIKISKNPISTDSFLNKIIFLLLGVFFTGVIFMAASRLLPNQGVWIGLTVSILIIAAGFYYGEKQTRTRLIIWGMVTTLLLSTILFLAGLNLLNSALN
ncbi:hypothetical protein HY605_01995 [Candidatus Peregrinibacteria bacterium]|nr:hypothetical protein [Candidatus Peregrinibacteria bacterium]